MAQTIAITVANKRATTDFQELVSFNDGYELNFTFDAEWTEYTHRMVVVRWEGGEAETLMSGNTCQMPAVTNCCAYVSVGVYGVNGEKRIASTFVTLRCEEGTHTVPHEESEPLTFREQVLGYLNERDWSIFDNQTTEGTYSCVTVDRHGLVTNGKSMIEIGAYRQIVASDSLAEGGLFFCKGDTEECILCYKVGNATRVMDFVAQKVKHFLNIGSKVYNGREEVTVTKSDLELGNVPNFHPYPVGSIYMSVSSTSPASRFGGSWERLKDVFLVGTGDTYAGTGGSASHTHSLEGGYANIDIPNASPYTLYYKSKSGAFKANCAVTSVATGRSTGSWNLGNSVELGGNSASASNLPPYQAVYMWKRVS